MKSQLIETRQIRVFISSTFRDLKDEREYLLIHTFPKLRRLAADRDVTLTEIDLRWGISEEESKTGKVVEICLSEIDNCIPFFIGIIGYRYGWIPTKGEICDSTNMHDRYKWVYNDIESKISVTEMEMQYGVLRRNDPTNAYFYIMSDGMEHPDIDYPDKLANLISSVRQNGRYPVRSYHSVEDLALTVEKDFIEMLDRLFPMDGLDPHEIERKKQHACINQHIQSYVPNESDLSNLDSFLASDSDYLTVYGECGSGKSALLSNWAYRISQNDSYYTLYYSTGGNGENEGCYWLKELKRLRHCPVTSKEEILEDGQEWVKELNEDIAKSDKPVILILDDVSKYQQSDNWKINSMSWLPITKGGSKTIMASSVSKYSLAEFWKEQNGVTEESMDISPLSKDNIKEIVCRYLKNYGKKLTDVQLERISSFPLSSNAGILSTLLDSLVYYGSFETLNEFMNSFLDTGSKADFYDRYLSHIESHFEKGLVENVLMMIALPLYGLKEYEIKECLHLKPLTWSQVYYLLSRSFCLNDGCLRPSNMDMEDAIIRRYQSRLLRHRRNLVDYLEKSLTSVLNDTQKARYWDELLNQYYILGQNYDHQNEMADKAFTLISKPDVMWYLTTKRASMPIALNGEGKQIYKYWKWLRNVNPQKYSLTSYIDCGISDELFFFRSSDFCDIAQHANDLVAASALAIKAIDLYRAGIRPNENEEKFFMATLSSLSIAAFGWNLLKLAKELKAVRDYYDVHRTLLEMKGPERCIRLLTSVYTANDPKDAIEEFKRTGVILDQLGEGYCMDKAMIFYWMAEAFASSMPEESLRYINAAIELSNKEIYQISSKEIDELQGKSTFSYGSDIESDDQDEGYDDYTECIKAEMLGLKGLILKNLKRFEEAYDSIEAAIIRYEDIEDMRMEHGNMCATINEVMRWNTILMDVSALIR